MRLRREMHHGVDFLGLQQVRHEVARADVALDELEVGLVRDGAEVAQGGAVVELIECDDTRARVAVDEEGDDVRGDETGAAFFVCFESSVFFLLSERSETLFPLSPFRLYFHIQNKNRPVTSTHLGV